MQIVETSALVHQIGWSLLHSLWQDALIGSVLAALLKLLSRAKPQSRYFIACVALAAMIILPVITAYVLHTRQTEAPGMVIDDDSTAVTSVYSGFRNTGVIENERIAGTRKINWLNRTITETRNTSARVEKFLPWLILLWLAGVFIYAVKLGGGLFRAANLRKLTVNVSNPKLDALVNELTSRLSIKRKIKICESSLINVPMTMGWIYPLILIPPSSLSGLTPFQLQTIISHELIHIKRCDFLINFLQSVAETLLFYHPAAIWASRRIREEREYICDDLTLALCRDSVGYARALTKVARFQRQAEQLAVAATGGELKDRIYRLVSNPQNPGSGKKSILPNVWATVVISLFLAITFGGLKVLSNNKEAGLEKQLVAGVREADKIGAEKSSLTGEYKDDVSKENPRFREAALQALKGHRGSVIVMNPRTGQVYTIVNQDWAFRRARSAGSTFKMITGLAGSEENQLEESSKGFGYNSSTQMNLAKALAVYNNDYFKSLGQSLGSGTLIKYSRQFGLGEKTGINYPDETGGYVPEEMASERGELTGVTGGDIQITPLQLAVFVSAIYNGGKILIPQAANGNDSVTPQERGNLSIGESSVEELKKGLRAAVETGTGKRARQENYKVSGKTGSISNKETNIGLFASYGANRNSEMVVVVVLEGKNVIGAVAAEVAGKIYDSI
ncbi:MAG TPA: penicillin-binding transpeptidase domain-containing protein [Pyrinomonadaceae bacterium]|jgi:beta-lactamase regulating signal transducer with metallopeptidase domain